MDPGKEQKSALGVGSGAFVHQVLVNTLTRYPKVTSEIGLFAAISDQPARFGGEFVPKRRVGTGANGGAAGNAGVFFVGFAGGLGGCLCRIDETFNEALQQQ